MRNIAKEQVREWENARIRGWRARGRKWRGAIVDSESHLASRLLFIVPCYSGFPRQSGRDAIKKRKQERRTRGERGRRESSCWWRARGRGRGTKCRESDESRVAPTSEYADARFFFFFFFFTIIILNNRVGISIEEKRDRDNDYVD